MKTPVHQTPTHPELVKNLQKPGHKIIPELTVNKIETLHMAVGVCGEAGELIDAIKKYALYNQELDRGNVLEELGDIEFYLEGIRQVLGITREQTLNGNVSKLMVRYEEGMFTNEAAKNRLDKKASSGYHKGADTDRQRHHPQCECLQCRPNQSSIIPVNPIK